MLADFVDRMLGEILVDLRNDLLLHVVMKSFAQIGERTRRRDHDQSLDLALAHHLLKRCGGFVRKLMFFQLVPVGLADARAARTDRGMRPARAVAALVVGRRILLVDKDPLGLEVRKFRTAFITENERLMAVTDKNIGVMGNSDIRSHWSAHGSVG